MFLCGVRGCASVGGGCGGGCVPMFECVHRMCVCMSIHVCVCVCACLCTRVFARLSGRVRVGR